MDCHYKARKGNVRRESFSDSTELPAKSHQTRPVNSFSRLGILGRSDARSGFASTVSVFRGVVRAVDEDDAVTFVLKGSDAVPNGEECFCGEGHR